MGERVKDIGDGDDPADERDGLSGEGRGVSRAVPALVMACSDHSGYLQHRRAATGQQLLASGPGIEPASLALAGSTVYWTREGHPVSTTLD